MPRLRCSALVRAAACALTLGLAACQDAPTEPSVFAQATEGTTWVAVSVPAGVPRLESWLALRPEGSAGDSVLRRTDALRADAARALRDGDTVTTRECELEAVRIAIHAAARTPDPAMLASAFTGLDTWRRRAAGELETSISPELALATAQVAAEAGAARAALAAGDTLQAMERLAAAAAKAEAHAPPAVALRALERAADNLGRLDPRSVDAARAKHLLATARVALAEGEGSRALRRALYALQLAENARGLPDGAVATVRCALSPDECAEP
jgi:hypothetical protein